MYKKESLALILAGGQGSRLGVLTKKLAKPAVLYGGKYRIIDFPLSNCINSGIDTVGVLTQYRPLKLNNHIGIGKPWDLDRMGGGVTVLSPYMKGIEGEWYKGTADAVYQNIEYINKINPRFLIILSGDHIYKMDYSKVVDFHKKKRADATISVIEVPLNEASRFGIMNTDDEDKIYEFEEKPKNPKSTLASMGIYVFTWSVLREYLIRDSQNPDSVHDFGKNIINMMLDGNKKMWAYRFKDYWKDVGTVQAYWEANMDLVARVPLFNLFDKDWRIYTPNPVKPAHYVGSSGEVNQSLVAEGCRVYGKVERSVLFPGVYIDKGAHVKDSIIMSNSFTGENSVIDKAIIGENNYIGNKVKIGFGENIENKENPHIYNTGITVTGEHVKIPENVIVGKNVMIDNYVSRKDFDGVNIESGSSIFLKEEKAQ
jgi:glucose-1-phosphate adenylyltransferase